MYIKITYLSMFDFFMEVFARVLCCVVVLKHYIVSWRDKLIIIIIIFTCKSVG